MLALVIIYALSVAAAVRGGIVLDARADKPATRITRVADSMLVLYFATAIISGFAIVGSIEAL